MTLYVYRCPQCHGKGIQLVEAVDMAPRCLDHVDPLPMELLPDTAMALLPISNGTQFVPLKVEHLKEAGILLPSTQHALEWLYRHRARNGMAGAFLVVGGRRCIDLVAFARLMRERKA